MNIQRIKNLLGNPASTRQELEVLRKQALDEDEREIAFDIQTEIDERFQTRSKFVPGTRSATAIFRSRSRCFDSANAAYIWLIDCFFAEKPEIFSDVRMETTGLIALGRRRTPEGKPYRNYFAQSPKALFRRSPHLAEKQSNSAQLQNGWYANLNRSNPEKFDQLCHVGELVGLKFVEDWNWVVLNPSDDLKILVQKKIASDSLFAELDNIARSTAN